MNDLGHRRQGLRLFEQGFELDESASKKMNRNRHLSLPTGTPVVFEVSTCEGMDLSISEDKVFKPWK